MSTTIYNAVRFASGMNLTQVVQWCAQQRPAIQKAICDKQIQRLLYASVNAYDAAALAALGWAHPSKEFGETASALGMGYRRIRDQNDEDIRSNRRSDSAEIILFPHGRYVYGIVYMNEAQKFIDSHMSSGVMQDYSYWNNSDEPDGVSARQWNRRKQVWDEIFKDSSVPAEVGVSVQLSRQSSLMLNFSEFFDHLRDAKSQGQPFEYPVNWPSFARRVISMSHMIAHAPWYAEYHAEEKGASLSTFMRLSREVESGESETFNQARPFLEAYALEQLTWERLHTPFEELKEHFAAQKKRILEQDVPLSLQTPLFQQSQFSTMVEDNATRAPVGKHKM